jgi:3-oxoacyl-[acyl-carrier protein] reductase
MSDKPAALVTGGSRGIGRAIALRLAREGYHILINYRSNDTEAQATQIAIEQENGSATLCKFDVTDRAVAMPAIESLCTQHKIRVLVLNAGIRTDELLIFMAEQQWDTVLNTNLMSFYNVAKPVTKHMVLNREGRIIVMSSTSGESGLPGQVHYSAAKAGVIGAVKALARECAKRNVLVNAITPGFITTDMTEGIDEKKMAATVPMNRFGTADEVAGVVAFLASTDAGYITGQVIGVNGGVYM